MMPLLEGTDGVKKMSKSLGNTIDLSDSPTDMFGKLMSISDDLMWRYYDLLSFLDTEEISKLKAEVAAGKNPRDVKYLLAHEIVARFYDDTTATKTETEFKQRFAKGLLPDDIPEKTIYVSAREFPLANILKLQILFPVLRRVLE